MVEHKTIPQVIIAWLSEKEPTTAGSWMRLFVTAAILVVLVIVMANSCGCAKQKPKPTIFIAPIPAPQRQPAPGDAAWRWWAREDDTNERR